MSINLQPPHCTTPHHTVHVKFYGIKGTLSRWKSPIPWVRVLILRIIRRDSMALKSTMG